MEEKKINKKIQKPNNFSITNKLQISSEDMIIIWKNIEECFLYAGFNRWGFADELGVRRQTLDQWIRSGSVPSVVIIINISRILNLPIDIILDPNKSCIEAYKNNKITNISFLSEKVLKISDNQSILIPSFVDYLSNRDIVKTDDYSVLILPKCIFDEKVTADNLFWLYSSSLTSFFSLNTFDLLILLKKDYYWEDGIYLIKEDNELKLVSIKFNSRKGKIVICYNDNNLEENTLKDDQNLAILGKLVKKITI